MKNFKKLFFWVIGFLFPSVCPLCGKGLMENQEIREGLCEKCRLALVLTKEKECNLCGRPLISERDLCLSCRNGEEKSWEKLWVIFPYTGKYRNLLSEYKFKKNLRLAEYFAEQILGIIFNTGELNNACIVPVPPRPGKIKVCGWDQVDYLVKRLKKIGKNKISVCRCLKRKKSKTQKSLGRKERMENLKGRICVQGKVPQTAFVIDDVITTGSTMETCASVLKEAGAKKVYGLCLFYD
ncbi:MAG: ComF family protein [Treponema sp.]|jgi:ComF family protein|nr:ComF family protein [Treponema sp.]